MDWGFGWEKDGNMRDRPPYRPYQSGPPAFQPAMRKLTPPEWLAPDPDFAMVLPQKRQLLQTRRAQVYQAMPGHETAQAEARKFIEITCRKQAPDPHEPDLIRAALLVTDDLCVMEKLNDAWVLTSGMMTAPTHWSLGGALGKSLGGLHRPVPGGDPELAAKVNLMFDRMPPANVFERFNWTVQAGDQRYMPDATAMREWAATLEPETALDELFLRVERQTIIKLPETNAVLFCIRICIDPLVQMPDDELQILLTSFFAAAPHVRAYKKWDVFAPLLRPTAERLSVPV